MLAHLSNLRPAAYIKTAQRSFLLLAINLMLASLAYATPTTDYKLDLKNGDNITAQIPGQSNRPIGNQKSFPIGTTLRTADSSKIRVSTDVGYFITLGVNSQAELTQEGVKLLSGSIQIEKLRDTDHRFAADLGKFTAVLNGLPSMLVLYRTQRLNSACLIAGQTLLVQQQEPLASLGDADYCFTYDNKQPDIAPMRLLKPDNRNQMLTQTGIQPAPILSRQQLARINNQPLPEARRAPEPAQSINSFNGAAVSSATTPPPITPAITRPRNSTSIIVGEPITNPNRVPNNNQPSVISTEPSRITPPPAIAPVQPSNPTARSSNPPPTPTRRSPANVQPRQPRVSPANNRPIRSTRNTRNIQAGDTSWNLYLRSSTAKEDARRFAIRLQNAGHQAVILPYNRAGITYYRVAIFGFTSVKDARVVQQKIAQQFKVSDAWVGRQDEYE